MANVYISDLDKEFYTKNIKCKKGYLLFKNGEKIYFEKLYTDYPYVTGMKVVSK